MHNQNALTVILSACDIAVLLSLRYVRWWSNETIHLNVSPFSEFDYDNGFFCEDIAGTEVGEIEFDFIKNESEVDENESDF